jgi:hypothetical protein
MAAISTHLSRAILALLVGLSASIAPQPAHAYPTQGLVISEIKFDPLTGNDNDNQWIEIYNGTGADIDFAATPFSLGWGSFDYTRGSFDLNTGVIAAGTAFLVGGTVEPLRGGVPQAYDIEGDFNRDLPADNGSVASGVGLFTGAGSAIDVNSVPIHAVMYGRFDATNNLLDEQGIPDGIVIEIQGLLATGQSLYFGGGTCWSVETTPTPGLQWSPVPEPGTASMIALGLAILGCSETHKRQNRKLRARKRHSRPT